MRPGGGRPPTEHISSRWGAGIPGSAPTGVAAGPGLLAPPAGPAGAQRLQRRPAGRGTWVLAPRGWRHVYQP